MAGIRMKAAGLTKTVRSPGRPSDVMHDKSLVLMRAPRLKQLGNTRNYQKSQNQPVEMGAGFGQLGFTGET